MKREAKLLLIASIGLFAYSARVGNEIRAWTRGTEALREETETSAARAEALLARANGAVGKISRAEAVPPFTIEDLIRRAEGSGLRIQSSAREGKGMRLRIEGEIAPLLALLSPEAREASIHPDAKHGEIVADILFVPLSSPAPPGTPEEVEKILAAISAEPRISPPPDTAPLAEAFLPASSTITSPFAGTRFARSSLGIEPEIPPPTLRYMGLVEGGRRKMTGIFRNDAGLVIAAGVGEEVQGYRILKIEADRAILALAASGGLPARGSRPVATVTLSRVLTVATGSGEAGEAR